MSDGTGVDPDPLAKHRGRVGALVGELLDASEPDAPSDLSEGKIAGAIANVGNRRSPAHERRLAAQARLTALRGDDLVSATLLLFEAAGRGWVGATFFVLSDIARTRPEMAAAQTLLALRLLNGFGASERHAEYLPMVLDNIERQGRSDQVQFGPHLREALIALEGKHIYPANLVRVRARVRALLPPEGATLDLTPIVPVDPWARIIHTHLRERCSEMTGDCSELLRLLADATSSAPSKKWRDRWLDLLGRRSELREVVRLMLEDLLAAEANPDAKDWDRLQHLIDLRNHDVLRGACWAAGISPSPLGARLLGDVVARTAGVSDKVANAGVFMLAEIRSKDAVAQLARLRSSVKQQGFLKQIGRALDSIAQWDEVSTFELLESSVPRFDLDEGGRKGIGTGDVTAVISVDDAGEVAVRWRDAEGRERSAAPRRSQGDRAAVAGVRSEAKRIAKALAAERSRLEELLAADRTWPLERWWPLYIAHPLTGAIARRLIWQVEGDGSRRFSALAGSTLGCFIASDGTAQRADSPGHRVRLWHPVRADEGDVAAWRAYVIAHRIRQPYKQGFREVYRIGDDEGRESSSLRFAGHVLRYQRMFALLKERRWATRYLGPWDGGQDGEARRDFEWLRLRAVFTFAPISTDDPHAFPIRLCSTKELYFVRLDDRRAARLPLGDVPDLVFSEASRDVDLFVSLCSIAVANDDVAWDDKRFARFSSYREQQEDRASPLVRSRSAALEEVLPRLPVAERGRLEQRELVVRGDLAVYRISVGTGTVRFGRGNMDLPLGDAVLPALEASKLYLPFEDDPILHRIVRSALLLGRDREITDAETLRRIRRGPVGGE